MAYYGNIQEEELKNKVANDLFFGFDTTKIIGRIDFCVSIPADPLGLNEEEPLFWAEAKKGTSHDIYESFIQLILTIGKERPQDKILPPAFIGAFDAEKIAFLPYSHILEVLRQNDFNWNVMPSNHNTKEFLQLKTMLQESINQGLEIYHYEKDAKELAFFIKKNFNLRKTGVRHIRINKNNFTHIYLKWLEVVKPSININWDVAKKSGIIDADFYLADILSKENNTLSDKLFVLLNDDHYLLDRKINDLGLENFTKAQFNDKQKAHKQFWNRYSRPPRREYWDDIVNRRDLLVPQDVRERKGSFFTPARWVELSQQYIAAELGENWQEEYYVWDCCAGTGNLLAGLTNKYNIYASTLDQADVQAMRQRIETMNAAARDKKKGGANLLESHVFQFDFLNDPFFNVKDGHGNVAEKSKLPVSLQEIIRDPEKRKKLVIYINPPYAEVSSKKINPDGKKGKKSVNITNVHKKYKALLGTAARELFTQFFIRIYKELPGITLAEFSTLKILQGSAFMQFRSNFTFKLKSLFVVPADTFDNVDGDFPIGFFIWDGSQIESFKSFEAHVYNSNSEYLCNKTYFSLKKDQYINKWISNWKNKGEDSIGFMDGINSNDFQHNNYLYIVNKKSQVKNPRGIWINSSNIIECCIYLSVRHCIDATWLNDRDQFLYPNYGWQNDNEFQTDCLVYTLFHGQNRISNKHGTNHWIPFTEEEVNAQEKFEIHFMSDFIQGKNKKKKRTREEQEEYEKDAKNYHMENVFEKTNENNTPLKAGESALQFSEEAQAVMDAGRRLWQYYHKQPIAKERPNASFYDIRLFFQGTKTTKSGKIQMNSESNDEQYTELITGLRQKMKMLAKKIEPKVYEYGFLRK